MFKRIACISTLAGLLALSMAAHADSTVNKSIRIPDGNTADGASSVNGSVTVGAGANVTGEVETVNGTIRIGAGAIVHEVSTVNGSIRMDENVQAHSVGTVNGSIRVSGNSVIDGGIEAVNGKITVASGSQVRGSIENVNGEIKLDGALLEDDIETVNGDITLENGAVVSGDIKIEKPGGWNIMNRKKRTPKITLGANTRVDGIIDSEREVEIYMHDSAQVGGFSGKASMDNVVRFSGNRP